MTLGWLLCLVSAVSAADHKVKSGESLEKIAKKYGVSKKSLLQANQLSNPNKLRLGQTLVIPGSAPTPSRSKAVAKSEVVGPGSYRVAKGENDSTIAKKAGLSTKALHDLNPGIDWRRLQIGTKLTLSPVARKPVAAKAAPSRPVAALETPSKPNPQKAKVAAVSQDKPALSTPFVAVKAGKANLRSSASESAPKRGSAPKGAVARVLETKGVWQKVQFAGGSLGWIREDLLVASTESRYTASRKVAAKKPTRLVAMRDGKRENLLSFAKRMIGVRYRYGAMSRSATDCSGFTTQVFRSQGIRLPRTSLSQSSVGTRVSRSSLRPGDLVFFRTGRGSRVSHVGIFVGNGNFIHASTGRGHVTIDALSSAYYNKRFVTARRVGNFRAELNSIPVSIRNDEVSLDDPAGDIPVAEEPTPDLPGLDQPSG